MKYYRYYKDFRNGKDCPGLQVVEVIGETESYLELRYHPKGSSSIVRKPDCEGFRATQKEALKTFINDRVYQERSYKEGLVRNRSMLELALHDLELLPD